MLAQSSQASAGATIGAWQVWLGLGVLLLFVIFLVGIAWWRSWGWNDPKTLGGTLRGLALPNGSVRSVIALLVVGGFILFAFFGRGVIGDNQQFTAVLGAWMTLTGAVSGFYFGARTGQTTAANNGKGVAASTPTFTSGTQAPPFAVAADGSVYLSSGAVRRTYVRREGAWVDVDVLVSTDPSSVAHQAAVDLTSVAPQLVGAASGADAYVVAEDVSGDNYRLARSDGTEWSWDGAEFSKT